MRARGTGTIEKLPGSRFYYIRFYNSAGKQIRQSTKSEVKAVAEQMLEKRLGEIGIGLDPAKALMLRYEDMREALLADYADKGHKSLVAVGGEKTVWGLPHVDAFFKGRLVRNITTDTLRAFVKHRKAEGAKPGTINRNLALLRRMMNLARQEGKLQVICYFPMQREAAPRKGFVEDAQFLKVRSHLGKSLWPIITFMYYTGVRLGEAKQIEWRQVHLAEKEIRLEEHQTKNGEPRIAPLTDELVKMLKVMFKKDGSVFDATNLRKDWKKATKAAGYPSLLMHDLRRSGVRNLVRAGVPEVIAMRISGHKTRSVFDRYNIVSTADIHKAMALRENKSSSSQVDRLENIK